MLKPRLDEKARTTMPGEKFVPLADGVTHYAWDGPEDGTPVVLVHGFSSPMFIWERNVPALVEQGFRVLRYDLYGRGLSDRLPGPYDTDLFDRQLLGLLDAQGLTEPIDVIGLSMGGAITVHFTDRHPERVKRMILFAPAGLGKTPGASCLLKPPGLGEVLIWALGKRIIKSIVENQSGGDPAIQQRFREEYARQLSFAGFEQALLSTLRNYPLHDLDEIYGRVGRQERAGALFWGTADDVVSYSLYERVQQLIPWLTFYPVDGAGHTANYVKAQEVNAPLVEFLSNAG